MKSKSSLWQAAWILDLNDGLATHDSGLRVRMTSGQGLGENATEMVEAFTPAHGAHNAKAMVQRLIREGEQLLIDPNSRGWRGKGRR